MARLAVFTSCLISLTSARRIASDAIGRNRHSDTSGAVFPPLLTPRYPQAHARARISMQDPEGDLSGVGGHGTRPIPNARPNLQRPDPSANASVFAITPGKIAMIKAEVPQSVGSSPQVNKMLAAWVSACQDNAPKAVLEARMDRYRELLASENMLRRMHDDLMEPLPEKRPDKLLGLAFGKVSVFGFEWKPRPWPSLMPEDVFGFAWNQTHQGLGTKRIGQAVTESTQSVEALATVKLESAPDVHGRLSDIAHAQGIAGFSGPSADRETVDVVHITWLVVNPNERRKEAAADLVHAIVDYARYEKRLVTVHAATPESREYFEKLGFESTAGSSSRLVYCGDFDAENAKGQMPAWPTNGGHLLDLLPQIGKIKLEAWDAMQQ